MLSDCLEAFEKRLEVEGEDIILDQYMLKDGTYLIIGKDGNIVSKSEIKIDKKKKTIDNNISRYRDLCYFDYHSDLISMNKPQDSSKIIHSNNYLSFWVKKESLSNGKLTPEVINKYYEILRNPAMKYEKTKSAMMLYQSVEDKIGKVDEESLERNKNWILNHIFQLEQLDSEIDLSKKEYLKIFFEADKTEYEKEGQRYFIPNIYNSNNYNIEVNDEILGLPDNNQGMNSKKPFLSIKTRKIATPYLLNEKDVMLQKQFFDYLMGFAAAGKYNVYVNFEKNTFEACKNDEYPVNEIRGLFLRIQKGKEVEIIDQDVVPLFNNFLDKTFTYYNFLGIKDDNHKDFENAIECEKYEELEGIVNEIFFSKMLVNNYFSKEDDIKTTDESLKRNLLLARKRLFQWFHLGNNAGMKTFWNQLSLELIKGSILNGYMLKAAKQINMRLSLMQYFSEGGEDMADFSVKLREELKKKLVADEDYGMESDREYYFGVGQLAAYMVYQSKALKKPQSLVNPFLNAKDDKKIKNLLLRYYKKYNYNIPIGAKKIKHLYAMVQGYEPEGPVMQDMITMGYTMNNILLETTGKGTK